MTVEVLQAGPETLIVASQRRGLRHLGVGPSGPFDAMALALANRVAGNLPGTPALEIALGPVVLRFGEAATIAAVPSADLVIDGKSTSGSGPIPIKAGATVQIGPLRDIPRIVLAVSGGIHVPEVLGSRTTSLPGGFGGFEGRRLTEGDRLATGETRDKPTPLPDDLLPLLQPSEILRVVPSAEFDELTPPMKQQLFTPFRLDPVSNRVGLRLQGPAFTFAPAASRMESGPVMPGVVQCPNDGTPMILGPDCGTTGGYPRLLSVITADLPLLARIWPGRTVRFRLVDQDEAIAVFRQRMAWTGDFVGEGWADALL